MSNVNERKVRVGGEWITATLMFGPYRIAVRKKNGLIKEAKLIQPLKRQVHRGVTRVVR